MRGTCQIEFEVVVVFLLDLYDQGFCFFFYFCLASEKMVATGKHESMFGSLEHMEC